MERHPENAYRVVPEIFFDLIARIVPGAVFLLVYWFQYSPSSDAFTTLKDLPWVCAVQRRRCSSG
jgi:hypothetical protein